MTFEPKVGWLLNYSYLWADDHRRGEEEGVKNRPCALVTATRREGNRIVVIVVPVTHTPPADPTTAIEIPAVTKARLGLDAQRSWIICNEANVFAWPGPDLRAAAGRTPPSVWFGPLPPKLATAAREKLLGFAHAGRLRQVPRTE
jgi:mRNA-degrading endonuclease toxin of MazEF toxin-antitoxin module